VRRSLVKSIRRELGDFLTPIAWRQHLNGARSSSLHFHDHVTMRLRLRYPHLQFQQVRKRRKYGSWIQNIISTTRVNGFCSGCTLPEGAAEFRRMDGWMKWIESTWKLWCFLEHDCVCAGYCDCEIIGRCQRLVRFSDSQGMARMERTEEDG
jgi:hypothetical protein